jgi:hypothetical protein
MGACGLRHVLSHARRGHDLFSALLLAGASSRTRTTSASESATHVLPKPPGEDAGVDGSRERPGAERDNCTWALK